MAEVLVIMAGKGSSMSADRANPPAPSTKVNGGNTVIFNRRERSCNARVNA